MLLLLVFGCGDSPAPEPAPAVKPLPEASKAKTTFEPLPVGEAPEGPAGPCVVRETGADGRYGCLDAEGRWAIAPIYKLLTLPKPVGYAKLANKKRVILHEDGRVVELPAYASMRDLGDGRFSYKAKKKWGLLDAEGKPLSQPLFISLGGFVGSIAPVCVDRLKCGYIDRQGALVVEPVHPVAKDGYVGNGKDAFSYVAADGTLVGPFLEATPYAEDLAWVRTDVAQWSVVDRAGAVLGSRDDVKEVQPFSEGLAAVRTADGWEYVDSKGTPAFDKQFLTARSFHAGLAAVGNENGKWGYVDKTGKLVVRHQYDGYARLPRRDIYTAMDFTEGRAAVTLAGRWGFIDASGEQVIPLRFEKVTPFEDGLARVIDGGDAFWIRTDGTRLPKAAHP